MHSVNEDWPARSRRLLAAAQAGDTTAVGELLDFFREYLLLVAREELPAALAPKVNPSDVVQDTYLEAHRLFARFEASESENLRPWLRSILLNKLQDLHKRYFGAEKRDIRRERSCDDSNGGSPLRHLLVGPDSTPSGQAARGEEETDLNLALARLPEHYRRVIVWRNWDAVSFVEIGNRLERTEEAARKLYVRALTCLQEEMGRVHGQ